MFEMQNLTDGYPPKIGIWIDALPKSEEDRTEHQKHSVAILKILKHNYPLEIIEWVGRLLILDHCTEQQIRIVGIFADAEVIRCTQNIFKPADDTTDQDVARARLENFFIFIEAAAELPDSQPYGSHLQPSSSIKTFSPPNKLISEMESVLKKAKELTELLRHIAPSITDTMPMGDSLQLLQLLNQLIPATHARLGYLNDKNNYSDALPDPNPAPTSGKNSWQNWMIHKLALLSEIYLDSRHDKLILEIHRVLLNKEESMNERTAAGIAGDRSFFDQDYANKHANTFTTWAIENNYPLKSCK